MKKLFFVILVSISFSQVANAGTVYRDRFIPGGVCMVALEKNTINAALIQEVYSGTFEKSENIGLKWDIKDSYKITEFIAFRVTMVNKQTYTIKAETLEKANQKKEEFLKLIKDTCNK